VLGVGYAVWVKIYRAGTKLKDNTLIRLFLLWRLAPQSNYACLTCRLSATASCRTLLWSKWWEGENCSRTFNLPCCFSFPVQTDQHI